MEQNKNNTNFLSLFIALGAFLIALGLPSPRTLARAQGVRDRHMVVIAIDALRADIFKEYAFDGKGNPPPNSFFRELSRPNGKYKNHLNIKLTKAVFPTYTFATWASIFTGTYHGNHGILGQNFYSRDLGKLRGYDDSSQKTKLLNCVTPDFIQIYGWDFNCAEASLAIPAISLSVVSGLAAMANLMDPTKYMNAALLYELLKLGATGLTVNDLFKVLDRPYIWVLVPSGFFYIPIPVKFTLFDLYETGGIQNGDLLKRTLYNYAHDQDFNTFVIHNFYNFSNLDQNGNRISWDAAYDGDLDNMDKTWGRPSWKETVDWIFDGTDNNEIFDKVVVSKAINYIKKNGLPHILTLYFSCVDGESHKFNNAKFGYSSLEQAQFATLKKTDQWLIQFYNFLKTMQKEYNNTIFLLISDHGQIPLQKSLSLKLPDDKYLVTTNGYMAHIYIKNSQTNSWKDVPTQQDFKNLMNNLYQYISLTDYENLVLGRDPNDKKYYAYSWDGNSWKTLALEKLEDSPYEYIDPETRINGLNNLNRSGDVILQPKKSFGFTGSPSTHGSLYEQDTDVPFYIFGEPVTKAQDFKKVNGPWILCGASHADITPTILNIFNIYEQFKGNFDGKPILNKDLKINFNDFAQCRGSGASDFLYGRWKNFENELTQIILHNPSSVSRDAVLLYYGWSEDFKACQIVTLSPHDLVELEPPLEGGGPVEIRAAPLQKEKRPGGLVGYVVHKSGGTAIAIVQLILDDPELFSIDLNNQSLIYQCACTKLQQKKSPLQKLFCP